MNYIDIIPNTEWGYGYGLGWGLRPLPAEYVILHHSTTASPPMNASFQQDVAAIKHLDWIGYERFKGSDGGYKRPEGAGISYTWGVPKSGRVFEGHDVRRNSSHTYGYNRNGVGIVLIGNYENDTVTPAQIESIARLLLQAKADGHIKHARIDYGHDDVYATLCPGKNAKPLISLINNRVLEILREEEDNMNKDRRQERINAVRLAGTSRWETARAVFEADLPAGRGILIAADGTPDERYVTARAGGDVRYLPVRANNDNPPGATAAAIKAYKPQWIRVAGGANVVTDECVINLLDAAGL